MPSHGTTRLSPRALGEAWTGPKPPRAIGPCAGHWRAGASVKTKVLFASLPVALCLSASVTVAEGIPSPLTDRPGNPDRGRVLVADQFKGLCILCHAGPFPEHRFMGTLAPSLEGVGSRLTVAELRARIVDSRRVNPDTIMPPYHATDGLTRVGEDWQDRPIFTAQEVEDVVAYLATLTEDPQ